MRAEHSPCRAHTASSWFLAWATVLFCFNRSHPRKGMGLSPLPGAETRTRSRVYETLGDSLIQHVLSRCFCQVLAWM